MDHILATIIMLLPLFALFAGVIWDTIEPKEFRGKSYKIERSPTGSYHVFKKIYVGGFNEDPAWEHLTRYTNFQEAKDHILRDRAANNPTSYTIVHEE